MPDVSLRSLTPPERIAAIVDDDSIGAVDTALQRPRPSPHLARWGIRAQDDDGILIVRASLGGQIVFVAAQDERFLGGSVGANHGAALEQLLAHACVERPAAVILVLASGGVRLHEANAAELALARALARLFDVRAAGIPVLALGVGDIFGGASIVACAALRLLLLAGTRLGLSGPRVIETAHGRAELDATDSVAVEAVFGANARAAAGHVEVLADNAQDARDWLMAALAAATDFRTQVAAQQVRLARRLADQDAGADTPREHDIAATPSAASARSNALFAETDALDSHGWLCKVRDAPTWIARPVGAATLGPREANALDAALLAHMAESDEAGRTLMIVEDSAGHEATRGAERLCVAQYLAHHAAVLALLRHSNVSLVGFLAGVGHSAAFFANALQAPVVCALDDARVIAMDPAAIARVTRLDPQRLAALIDNDPLLGQPVRCFAQSGGIARILREVTDTTLATLASASGT